MQNWHYVFHVLPKGGKVLCNRSWPKICSFKHFKHCSEKTSHRIRCRDFPPFFHTSARVKSYQPVKGRIGRPCACAPGKNSILASPQLSRSVTIHCFGTVHLEKVQFLYVIWSFFGGLDAHRASHRFGCGKQGAPNKALISLYHSPAKRICSN